MAVEFMMYIVENTFSYTLKNYAFSNLLNMLYMFYGYEDEEYFMKAQYIRDKFKYPINISVETKAKIDSYLEKIVIDY